MFPFYVDILPDRDVENVVLPATTNGATWVQNERSVSFDFAIDRLVKTNYKEGFNIWEGQPISIEDREYIIAKAIRFSVNVTGRRSAIKSITGR